MKVMITGGGFRGGLTRVHTAVSSHHAFHPCFYPFYLPSALPRCLTGPRASMKVRQRLLIIADYRNIGVPCWDLASWSSSEKQV